MNSNQSWDAFAYFYSQAFEAAMDVALKRRREKHSGPMIALGCHSIELTIKAAIVEICGVPKFLALGRSLHDLQCLWDELIIAVSSAGISSDNEFAEACREMLAELSDLDKRTCRGEYPTTKTAEVCPYFEIDLPKLAIAHNSILTYIDGLLETARQRHEPIFF